MGGAAISNWHYGLGMVSGMADPLVVLHQICTLQSHVQLLVTFRIDLAQIVANPDCAR